MHKKLYFIIIILLLLFFYLFLNKIDFLNEVKNKIIYIHNEQERLSTIIL